MHLEHVSVWIHHYQHKACRLLPNNFSAPPEPMIVLESVCELTANAILEGILFLIIP